MMMKKSNILFTGGTGFFACSLLDMISAGSWHNCYFTMLSRHAEEFAQLHPKYSSLPNVKFVSSDVRLLKAYKNHFHYIIHAATPAVNSPEDAELQDIIVNGTRLILDFAQRAGTEKILYISSGGVYGNGTAPFSEEMVCNPVSAYGKAKLEAEQLVLQSAIPSSIMRGFAFCGKHLPRNAHFAFGNFLEAALNNQEIIIKGDGTPLRSYMHADDLACWMMTMLFEGRAGRIYNCGSPEAVSIKALAERINALLNPSGKITVQTPAVPGGAASSYVPDVTLAESELGLKLQVSLDEAIRRSV